MIGFDEALSSRIVLLDGAMGTMIQTYSLSESDYRGARFASHPVPLKGCNDVLTLTKPEVIAEIHRSYLDAGADIITTCTFNCNAFSLSDYQLSDYVFEIAKNGAAIARKVVDDFMKSHPDRSCFVGGSIGPTSKTSSIAVDVENPGLREVTFDELVDTYTKQIQGLMAGGADILMLETFFDILNAKAVLFAAEETFKTVGKRLPIMISGTLSDQSGRTLSGQTVEAFYASVSHANPVSVGFNCGLGAKQLMPYIERLSLISESRIAVYPNAGLPNVHCGYDQTPEMFCSDLKEYLERGLVNVVGGCCGTTPKHIEALSHIIKEYATRPLPQKAHVMRLSGLEPLTVSRDINFVNIGERTNVAGSAKFAKMIREGAYDEALSVARAQVDAGAQMVDVCMDAAMIDAPKAMHDFLSLMTADPEIVRVPVMIDSSSWEVLETGLKLLQGKSVVNSISLKEGEARFVEKALKIHEYGAAVVVMLFDEKGQADTYERKISVAKRAYDILVKAGFPAEDIIMDPNILAVATGIEEHDQYAKAYIDATRWIKENLPYVKISGGVSNLSFAFRGNNLVREAMHSAFLYHAIQAGMDMGIVNAQALKLYEDIDPELLERVEDVILCRRPDATERLIEFATRIKNETTDQQDNAPQDAWRNLPLQERIAYSMQHGISDHVEEDVKDAIAEGMKPIDIIDKLLMPPMDVVGKLFGEGKMFLPQVVKSARVMKNAVTVVTPLLEQSEGAHSNGVVLIATVKGDVHDIGKNIVSVVLSCNGFEVHDLGVMVEPQVIIDSAIQIHADVICLSGLITPSLEEMRIVCQEAERRGLGVPIIIGGATTSALHTAVKIAPCYSGVVAHADNASSDAKLISEFLGSNGMVAKARLKAEQQQLRQEFEQSGTPSLVSLSEARKSRKPISAGQVLTPRVKGVKVFDDVDIKRVIPYIDWSYFFAAWGIAGHYPEITEHPGKGDEAKRLLADAQAMLKEIIAGQKLRLQAVVGIFDAYSSNDDICIIDKSGKETVLSMLRNQTAGQEHRCLSDSIATENDYVGCFALTAGAGLKEMYNEYKLQGDEYKAIMSKFLVDRLTEAFAEYLHLYVRRTMWGFEKETAQFSKDYQGSRLAFGYPALPDHTLKRDVFGLLGVEEETVMRLTDNYMIVPEEAICGLIFSNAKPFSVGKIDEEQFADYANRRGMSIDIIRKTLAKNIL